MQREVHHISHRLSNHSNDNNAPIWHLKIVGVDDRRGTTPAHFLGHGQNPIQLCTTMGFGVSSPRDRRAHRSLPPRRMSDAVGYVVETLPGEEP